MPYLIDSDIAIDHLEQRPEILEFVDILARDRVAISIVIYMELFQGAERHDDRDLAHERLGELVQDVPMLPFSLAVAQRCARLRQDLRRRGRRVRTRALDLIIAATVLEYGLSLATRTVDDHADIPGFALRSP